MKFSTQDIQEEESKRSTKSNFVKRAKKNSFFALPLLVLLITSCAQNTKSSSSASLIAAADATLELLHLSASKADGETYFEVFSRDAVFMGTDPKERWTVEDFKKYAMPYFKKGKGWTYTKENRFISLSEDKKTAWFDEMLMNKSYGICRGSGVLIYEKGTWKVAQYNLSIPMPNDLTKDFVKKIKKFYLKK